MRPIGIAGSGETRNARLPEKRGREEYDAGIRILRCSFNPLSFKFGVIVFGC